MESYDEGNEGTDAPEGTDEGTDAPQPEAPQEQPQEQPEAPGQTTEPEVGDGSESVED